MIQKDQVRLKDNPNWHGAWYGVLLRTGCALPALTYLQGLNSAVLAPGFAGLYQVAIQIPLSLTNGDYPVVATVNGAQSPGSTLITIQQ